MYVFSAGKIRVFSREENSVVFSEIMFTLENFCGNIKSGICVIVYPYGNTYRSNHL